MSAGTVLRWGEIWATLTALASERPRALFGYLAAGVLIPWMFFFIFPQSNMRGFAAFMLNDGWYSAETPWTIVSMFLIAFVAIGGFIFAAWSALLVETRDAMSGEILTGFVNSLLASIVALVIFALLIGGLSAVIGFTLGNAQMLALPVQIVLQLLVLAVLLFFLSRWCLAGPAMAAEGSINPLYGLTRSWALTRGHVGKILMIVGPLYLLASFAIGLFVGLALSILMATDGSTWHDNALSAGWLAIETALVLAIILIPAALYRAIRPAVDTEVFA
jgi:hypothetical protein